MEAETQIKAALVNKDLVLQRLEERLWVMQAQAGDREAFGRLMARHERQLLYFLRRFIFSPEEAVDAHQEIWLDVFRGLSGLRSPEAFRVWLYRLAHARASRFVEREVQMGSITQPIDESHLETTEESFSPADAEAVHQALDRLPPNHREVLTLHYLRDLSLEEISAAISCPPGTVKSRLHHARIAMRRQLERNRYE